MNGLINYKDRELLLIEYLTIIILTFFCNRISINPSEIEIGNVEGAMMTLKGDLDFEGACGGTERVEVKFEKIKIFVF